MGDRETLQFERDLMRKCGVDVGDAIMQSMMLTSSRISAAVIATGGAATALGLAAGAFAATCEDQPNAEDAANAMWEKLRPMVLTALEQRLDQPND